jgi:hypothetical protein
MTRCDNAMHPRQRSYAEQSLLIYIGVRTWAADTSKVIELTVLVRALIRQVATHVITQLKDARQTAGRKRAIIMSNHRQ